MTVSSSPQEPSDSDPTSSTGFNASKPPNYPPPPMPPPPSSPPVDKAASAANFTEDVYEGYFESSTSSTTTSKIDVAKDDGSSQGSLSHSKLLVPFVLIASILTSALTAFVMFAVFPHITEFSDMSEDSDPSMLCAPYSEAALSCIPPQHPQPPLQQQDSEVFSNVPYIAQLVTPSVVRVDVGDGFFADEFEGLGSGVVYSQDGYIITNNHVIEGASNIRVSTFDNQFYEAQVVGVDVLNDLAVLRIDASNLIPIVFRDVDAQRIVPGETAIAIGSPFGLDATVTVGVISALNRDLSLPPYPGSSTAVTIPGLLQTDAAINPGNSGGALVDTNGHLIGINTAIYTDTGGSQGVGFAVPVQRVLRSVSEIITSGEVEHPQLGVMGTSVSPSQARELDLPVPHGTYIEEVSPGSAAFEAGLLPGDVIISFGGVDVIFVTDLVREVRSYAPGDSVSVVFVRDGVEKELTVVLGLFEQ